MTRTTVDAALEPVRAAMLRRAEYEAGRLVSQAAQAASEFLARAEADAEAAVARAKADGAAQARPAAAALVGRGRRAARSAVLGAQLTARDELAGRIRAAVLGLRSRPGYPLLRERLGELAGEAAGPGAVVTEHPDGGVVARAPGVVVDCSLPRLADRAVAMLASKVAALCGP